MFHVPEQHRTAHPLVGRSDRRDGNNGAFQFRIRGARKCVTVFCVASDGAGWEHVSVSIRNGKRCPTWEEMCAVRNHFWDPEDTVLQFHPPKRAYVNQHNWCLHLWRPANINIRCPPPLLVGVTAAPAAGEPGA